MMFNHVKEFCNSQGLYISQKQLEQMDCFCSFLNKKNKVMNLTAINDPEEMEIKHLVDSLEGVPVIKKIAEELETSVDDLSLIDVGCGAGFPGIPLKILLPETYFVLLDSLHKRIEFVKDAVKLIGLDKIQCFAARAEEFADEEHRESFDICVSRAVAEMNVLLEYCLPFVKVGGYCILYKSDNCAEEIEKATNALNLLGGSLSDIYTLELPKGYGSRTLLVIKKTSETPLKYPRRPGKPSKKPL